MSKDKKDKKDKIISLSQKACNLALSNLLKEKKELELLVEDIKRQAIQSLLLALKAKDDYTYIHSVRVAFYSISLGKEYGLDEVELEELEIAAVLHDLGKIGVSDQVLLKPDRLDESEFKEMMKHPSETGRILSEFTILKSHAKNATHHHERYDGRGYPSKLKGEDIPLFSRIILIADTFDAMTSTRPYRKGLPYDIAFQELLDFSGSQFDPNLVKVFIACMEKEESKKSETFNISLLPNTFKKDAA